MKSKDDGDDSDSNNNTSQNKSDTDNEQLILEDNKKESAPISEHQVLLNILPNQLKEKLNRIDMNKVIGLNKNNQDFIIRKFDDINGL